jgi:hypothetical protein
MHVVQVYILISEAEIMSDDLAENVFKWRNNV